MLTETEARHLLEKTCRHIDVEFGQQEIGRFLEYKDLLISWNVKMNLTAITDEKQIFIKHFADSLALLPFIGISDSIIDIGTGAGFPGIPIKIVRPFISLTLLDSQKKRVCFLEAVSDRLSLEETRVLWMRAEDAARTERQGFDISVSRAVARLNLLSEYCLPFVRIGGTFLAMKGADVSEEIEEAEFAVRILGGRMVGVHQYEVEGNSRTIVEIKKIGDTPPKYPRKAGKPEREPLISMESKHNCRKM